MSYDVMLIGPATEDENIDYNGNVVHEIGGAVFFGAFAARAAGANTYVSVKMNPEDEKIKNAFELDQDHISVLPSEVTTLMRNTYYTPDRERRKAECIAQSGPVMPAEIPDVTCSLYHLAGLLYGDFPLQLIKALKKHARLSADIQGFLRHNENGAMNFHDWEDKMEYLKYFDFLKTDAIEAEILTGCSDRREAARMLHDWGVPEMLISHNTEMLVYDGKKFHTQPVRSRNLSGRTGRGDTVFSAYIARRILGDDIDTALLFATAAVSLKMEKPGPLRASADDIRAYIQEFYKDH